VLPDEYSSSVPNDPAGWAILVEQLRGFSITAIGIEASGGRPWPRLNRDPGAPVLWALPVAAGNGFFGVGSTRCHSGARGRLTPNRARSTGAEVDRPQDGISENGGAHAGA
jgi:hypothetical protein